MSSTTRDAGRPEGVPDPGRDPERRPEPEALAGPVAADTRGDADPDPDADAGPETAGERALAKQIAAQRLDPAAEAVLRRFAARQTVARDLSLDEGAHFGERLADRVAEFGGSWAFILIFATVLLLWAGTNLVLASRAFDPYPFVFLNLLLSMLAAVQAPVIMMSQNRQAAKDRLNARHDYEVNLKADLEIMGLHEKMDCLREQDLARMIDRQDAQIAGLAERLGRIEAALARDRQGHP